MELYYGVIPSSEEKGTNLYILREKPDYFLLINYTVYTHKGYPNIRLIAAFKITQEKNCSIKVSL